MVALGINGLCFAQEGTHSVHLLTPETALRAAQAALTKCRADGYQVAVAVVDRSGVTQVVLRDRFAGPHTPDMAADAAPVRANDDATRSRKRNMLNLH